MQISFSSVPRRALRMERAVTNVIASDTRLYLTSIIFFATLIAIIVRQFGQGIYRYPSFCHIAVTPEDNLTVIAQREHRLGESAGKGLYV